MVSGMMPHKIENQSSPADKGVEAPKVLENSKEETEALLHTKKQPTHNEETQGLHDDIDVNTPLSDIKGPNVLERVKEEFEAIVESIHQRKEDKNQDSPSSAESFRNDAAFTGLKYEKQSSLADHKSGPSKMKQDNIEVKEETPKKKSLFVHHKETHGRGEDIDVDTPISEFRGPSIFHRAKEEFEAIVDTIQSKKDSDQDTRSPKKEGGLSKTKQDNIEVKEETPKKKLFIHHKETHGKGEDIDVDTPISEFRGPSIFHRAKEEFEAIVDTIQSKKDSDQDTRSPKKEGGPSKTKQDNIEVKEETPKKKKLFIHHKETHGKGEDIDVDTPISEFRGPSIFHRAKEEIEAIVDTIQSKKDSDQDTPSPKKEGGFRATISKKLQTIYTKDKNRD
ncbi:uncharacterized protein LOC112504526 isoform X2 [Cynara cardunculus var. scolymus]|uniref:uncharacterized protein LOC112504526 isoform X2 n=1 Tax=Cynara cardunculus var. scolymus TaxID=59895 RepID=UPI000D6243A5|nr:uncharacterized protein LOC112504526 isoform X2 [Cynara cardunculus var. scolymus]